VLALSNGKRGIHRIAPVAVAAIVAVLAPTGATAANASTVAVPAGATAVNASTAAAPTNLLSCYANPLRITEAGKPAPNPDKLCQTDQVAGARSTSTIGGVKVTATGIAGATAVTTGTVTALAAGITEAGAPMMKTVTGQATAMDKSAHLVIGKTVIDLGMMTTKSTITCTYGARSAKFSFKSVSSVGSLKINGKSRAIGNGARSIALPAGTLVLNHTTITPTGITQHAAMLHTTGADVVLGEAAVAIANTPKNACHPA
jgi:hypothetical protein